MRKGPDCEVETFFLFGMRDEGEMVESGGWRGETVGKVVRGEGGGHGMSENT